MRSASPDGDATQSQAVLPQMLSHAAFISRDTAIGHRHQADGGEGNKNSGGDSYSQASIRPD
jgi:hypothetical protein